MKYLVAAGSVVFGLLASVGIAALVLIFCDLDTDRLMHV